MSTYRSAGNAHLNLAASGANELSELVADAAQETQAVVLGQCLKEILDGCTTGTGSGVLLELGDDGGLVGGTQGRRFEYASQFRVAGHQATQLAESIGSRLKRRALDGSRVLLRNKGGTTFISFPPCYHLCLKSQFFCADGAGRA